jgi:hypothetical protein
VFKVFGITAILCLLFVSPVMAETENYSLVVNGAALYSEAPPIVEGANVLLPLRVIAESTGASVQYVAIERQIIISKPGLEAKLRLDNYSCYRNREQIVLTSPPKLINDRTYITREQVNQILGLNVFLNIFNSTVVVQN